MWHRLCYPALLNISFNDNAIICLSNTDEKVKMIQMIHKPTHDNVCLTNKSGAKYLSPQLRSLPRTVALPGWASSCTGTGVTRYPKVDESLLGSAGKIIVILLYFPTKCILQDDITLKLVISLNTRDQR